jgi:two-component sensor histidine kinase
MRDSGDPIGAWLVVLVVGAGLATTAAVAAYLAGLGKTAEIARARAQLLRMLDGLGPLAWLLNADGTVVHANSAANAALAKHDDTIVGRPLWRLPLPADGGSIERIKAAIRRATLGEDSRFDLMQNDEEEGTRVFDLWIRPLKDSAAAPANLVASAVDITDRHEAEQTQRMLMRELDHRMKNTLQVIQAVIRRTARAQTSVAMFEHALLGRIETMSRAHELLAEERWLGAEMKAVITQEVDSFDASGAIRVDGPRLRLNPRGALSIALAVHEIGTNASVVLRWRESAGPPVSPPKSRGFGSMLIERSIAYELEGRTHLDYRRDGLVCTISIPIRMLRSFVNERPLEYVH